MSAASWDYAQTFHTCPGCDGFPRYGDCGVCNGCGDVQWPSHVRSDSGEVFAFSGLEANGYSIGLYGGMDGYAFSLNDAREHAAYGYLI